MPEDDGVLNSAEEIVGGPGPVLRDVRFYKISAELNETSAAGAPGAGSSGGVDVGQESADDEATDISVEIGLRTRQEGNSLGIRIEFTASQDEWRVALDVAAEFEAKVSFQTSEAGRTDFADKVGVMTLFPYIREAVGNLTQRTVGVSFILPTIRQGQVSFSDQEALAD